MNVDSSSRIRSGDAWARCSCRTAAGSILDGAVIVMLHFESSVRGSPEGSRGDRVRLRRHAHRATGTPLWRTPLLGPQASHSQLLSRDSPGIDGEAWANGSFGAPL